MKKKSVVPLPLRIIPIVFPWIERLIPSLALRFFIYLFTTPFRYKTPEKEVEATKTAKKFIVNLDGKKIQCYAWGTGPVVLFVHGWAGRGTQFRKFIEPLNQAGFKAIAMDGPAHGASDGKSTRPEEFSEAIFLVAQNTGGIAAIIAHSFGGIGSLFAISKGLPVRVLINIASPAIGDEIIKNYLRVINGSQKTGEAFKKRMLEKTGISFDEITSVKLVKKVPANLNLLLVHDEADKEVSIDHPRAVQKQFPKAQVYQTSGLGHNRILKDDQVIRDVVTFIQYHSSNT